FTQGFGSTAGLTLNGSTKVSGTRLRLTDGGKSEAGSAFTSSRVGIAQFATSFDFQITNANADGFAFVIQGVGANALGGKGSGLGYGGIANSVAVKFDLYNNAGEGSNSTGLFTNGATPTTPATDLGAAGIDLHSGHTFNVAMNYDGSTLKVTITDTVTGV